MIKKACNKLQLLTKKYLHFGRTSASAVMDMVEVKRSQHHEIGYWVNNTHDNHYSSRLPLAAMRVMAGFDGRRSFHFNPRANFFGEEKHKLLPLMIFPFIENKLNILRLKKNSNCTTALGFLELLQNLRWVIIQDCAILTKQEKREHVLFNMFPHIFKSELFHDFSNKMMEHVSHCEKKNPLSQSVDLVLPGVKSCLKNQTNAIYENGKSIKKVDVDLSDLMKVIQSQNINGHISTSLESFTQYIGKYKPPNSVYNVDEEKDISENQVLIEEFTINDMNDLPCRFDSFDDVIKMYDRILNNPEVSTFKVPAKFKKRYHRLITMMIIYNNSNVELKLDLFNRKLKDCKGSICKLITRFPK